MKTKPAVRPPIRGIRSIPYPTVHKTELSNGVQVFLIPGNTSDAVKLDLYFEGGAWIARKPLVTHFCSEMLLEGTSRYSSGQLMEKIDFLGSYVQTLAEKDLSGLSLFTIERKLSASVKIIKHLLSQSNFPQENLNVLAAKKQQQYMIEQSKPKVIARNLFMEAIFGVGHPYGRIAQAEDFSRVSRKDLQEYYEEAYGTNRMTIFLSGKYNERTLQLLEKEFGGQDWLAKNAEFHDHQQKKGELSIHIEKPDAIQAAIRIGREINNRDYEDYIGMQLLNTILGGYFGSRLMKNLREEKGYTYGIGSYIQNFKRSSLLIISSEVGKDYKAAAVGEIYKELAILQENLIPKSELNRVKNYFLGNLLHNFEGPINASDALKSLWEAGKDFHYVDRIVHEIKRLTPEDLRILAVKYFDKETLTAVTVG